MTAYRYSGTDAGLHVKLMKGDSVQNNRVRTSELIAAGGTINATCHVYPEITRLEIILFLATSFRKHSSAKLSPPQVNVCRDFFFPPQRLNFFFFSSTIVSQRVSKDFDSLKGGKWQTGRKSSAHLSRHGSVEDGAVRTANAREIPSLTQTLLTNLAGHLGQWTASIFNAYSSPLSHWSCQSTQAVSSCHTPAPTQMYSDTDYANLYLVSPPVPALGACYYIEAEIRVWL